jgi:hypothetical protein
MLMMNSSSLVYPTLRLLHTDFVVEKLFTSLITTATILSIPYRYPSRIRTVPRWSQQNRRTKSAACLWGGHFTLRFDKVSEKSDVVLFHAQEVKHEPQIFARFVKTGCLTVEEDLMQGRLVLHTSAVGDSAKQW